MVLEQTLQRFVERAPVCVMVRAVLENVYRDERIDRIFESTADRQYTRSLLFSTTTNLLSQVVMCQQPSVRAAFLRLDDPPVSLVSLYGKLNATEPAVSEALVSDTATDLAETIAALHLAPEPVPGFRLRFVDGNYLAGTEHRLDELRGSGAAALPGQSLVIYEHATGLIRELVCCEDAHRQERTLLPQVLERAAEDELYVGDRSFCTVLFMNGIARCRARFLVRWHAGTALHWLGSRKKRGRCKTGRVFEQDARVTNDPNGPVVRAIIIQRDKPLADGGKKVVLLTNVPRRKASARKLAELYLKRWTIEEAFRQLTQNLRCEVNTLGYPKAALLGFALAVMAFNALAVVRAAIAAEHGATVWEKLSSYYLALEVSNTSGGMDVAVPAVAWCAFAIMKPKELAASLRRIARHVRLRRYPKTKRGPKRPTKRIKVQRGTHVATARLLAQRKTAKTP